MRIPKPLLFTLAAFAAFAALGTLRPTQAHAQVSVSFFYDNLSPYGEWVQDPDYGYCWHPTNVDENWQPYTDGYWAYTDSGWTWVSYEDYGAIVYHYGRWANLPGEGWVWVPGYQWAPAWVSWRSNDDYVGWAPLPPEAHFRAGLGFGGWVDAHFDIGPGCFSFVRCGDFGAPALGGVILDRGQNVTIINRTTNITNITVNNSNIYNGGPSYAMLSARSTHPIQTLKLVRQGNVASGGGKMLSRVQGNSLVVPAPHLTAPTGKVPPPEKVAKTLAGVKPEHGWSAVKDPQERTQLESKFKSEAGTTLTPAHSVKPEDLKLVSDKIKAAPTPKPELSNESIPAATPKAKKAKGPSDQDLLNAPATETPGAAATPKSKTKGRKTTDETGANSFEPQGGGTPSGDEPKPKSKKAKTPSDAELNSFEPKGDATSTGDEPKPKAKVKKTPSDEGAYEPNAVQSAQTSDEEKPKKEKKSSDNPDLQPFNAGGAPAHNDEFNQGKGGPEPTGKSEDKKKKGKGEPTPQQ
jgi:hypothetical protein